MYFIRIVIIRHLSFLLAKSITPLLNIVYIFEWYDEYILGSSCSCICIEARVWNANNTHWIEGETETRIQYKSRSMVLFISTRYYNYNYNYNYNNYNNNQNLPLHREWRPFRNSARKDGAVFSHWIKKEEHPHGN